MPNENNNAAKKLYDALIKEINYSNAVETLNEDNIRVFKAAQLVIGIL